MKIKEAYIELLDKCNKLSSNANTKLEVHVAIRAINEAQRYWYDIRLKKSESDLTVQRELQHLIKTKTLNLDTEQKDYNVYTLPSDYYHINQLKVLAKKSNCEHYLDTFFTENANTQELFLNEQFTPDFEWQQTIASIKNDLILIYKKDFDITVELDYFKKLRQVDMKSNYVHIDGTASTDIDLEFEGSSADEILNIAAMLITGNTSNSAYQIHMNNIKMFE